MAIKSERKGRQEVNTHDHNLIKIFIKQTNK